MVGRIIVSAVIIVLVVVWLAAIWLMVMGPQALQSAKDILPLPL
jgi:hypothetical protein